MPTDLDSSAVSVSDLDAPPVSANALLWNGSQIWNGEQTWNGWAAQLSAAVSASDTASSVISVGDLSSTVNSVTDLDGD